MATKKAAAQEELFDPPTAEELDLQEFLEEVGPSTSVIHILRMKPDGGRPQVGKTTMDQVREDPWEFLRATYGAGKYMLLFRGSDRRIHGAKMIEVEGGVEQSHNGKPNGNGFQQEEKIPFHDRLMLYMTLRPQPSQQIDMGAMFMGIAAIMTAMKPNEQKSIDPVETFRTVMTMYESVKKKDEKDPLTQLREVAAVIKEFTPEGGEKVDGMWSAITSIGKDFIDKGSTVLSQYAPRPMPAAPVRVAPGEVRFAPPRPSPAPGAPGLSPGLPPGLPEGTVIPGGAGGPFTGAPQIAPWMQPNGGAAAPVAVPGPAPAAAPPAPPTPIEQPLTAEDNLNRWLTIQIGVLKQKARAGKDPADWIEYHFDNDEEPGVQAVFYAIRQGATFENLISFDPEIGQDPQLTGWFKALYEGLRNGRWEDGEFLPGLLSNSMDTRGQSGHARDNSANAAPGAPGPDPAGNPGTSQPLPDTDVH